MSTKLSLKKKSSPNPRQIRRDGNIPVTIYGKKLEESLSMEISKYDFQHLHLSRCVQTIDGDIEGVGNHTLLIKSIERNPVTDEVLNVQFHSVAADDLVKVSVPIRFEGSSPLVQSGGTLYVISKRVNLLCPAKLIPASIAFDLATLADEKSYAYFADLKLDSGLVMKSDAQQVIVKVSSKGAVAESTTAEATPAAEGDKAATAAA